MPRRRISEEETRKELIDPQLEKAGWVLRDHSKVKIEIPVDGYDAEPWNGVTDYILLYIKQHGRSLAEIPMDNNIVKCGYQHEAIRRVGKAFADG
jgi:type I site-specific restriction endonuclease